MDRAASLEDVERWRDVSARPNPASLTSVCVELSTQMLVEIESSIVNRGDPEMEGTQSYRGR